MGRSLALSAAALLLVTAALGCGASPATPEAVQPHGSGEEDLPGPPSAFACPSPIADLTAWVRVRSVHNRVTLLVPPSYEEHQGTDPSSEIDAWRSRTPQDCSCDVTVRSDPIQEPRDTGLITVARIEPGPYRCIEQIDGTDVAISAGRGGHWIHGTYVATAEFVRRPDTSVQVRFIVATREEQQAALAALRSLDLE